MMIRRLLTIALLLSALLVAFKPELKQPDHISPAVAMIYGPPAALASDSLPVRTFHAMTPFEREVRARSVFGYRVQYVPTAEERYDNRSAVKVERGRFNRRDYVRIVQ